MRPCLTLAGIFIQSVCARVIRVVRTIGILGVLACAIACTPRYNWQDTRTALYVATFPGKSDVRTQDVDLGIPGGPVAMTMRATRIGEAVFLVATIESPSSSPGSQAMLGALQLAAVQNIQGTSSPCSAAVVGNALGGGAPGIEARVCEVRGTVNQVPEAAHISLAQTSGHIVEIMVVGPALVLDSPEGREAVQTFMTGIALTGA